MNVVFLSALLGRARPLAMEIMRQVHAVHPLHAVLRIEVASHQVPWQKLRTASFGKLARAAEERLFYRWYLGARDRHLEERMGISQEEFETALADPLKRGEVIRSDELNSAKTAQLLRSLQADLLLVCGAPLLTAEVFTVPRFGTVNVHLGISPNYRGDHTEFWPLYFADWDNLGATLHRIDRGIDSGEILAHVFPELTPFDSDVTILEKMGRRIAPVICEFLQDPASSGIRQHELGRPSRLFLGRHRRIWHDVHYQALRMLGRRRIPAREERVIRYFEDRAVAGDATGGNLAGS